LECQLDRQRTLLVFAAAAFCGLCATASATHVPGAPINDDYLQSLRLNEPGQRLERKDTLGDRRDASNASVQPDLFNPPSSGGPAEPTQCQGVSYGRTIWYDFYPDVSGLARIRASGYDTVISVVPFNRSTGQPNLGALLCSNASSSTTEEFLVRVRRRGSYSIQLGGVADAGGSLEFLFDFLADTDGDGVLDDVDRCKRLDGPERRSGCPPRLKGEVTLRARPTAGGIALVGLKVSATSGSRVVVRCSRGCRRQVKRARRIVGFPRLRGRRLPAGSKLVVRVTKRGAIGAYTSYTIRSGNFKKVERCTNPGSSRPRKRCG